MSTPKQARMQQEPELKPEVGLYTLVREALQELDGNVEKAISRIVYKLRADKGLLESVVAQAVRAGVKQTASNAQGNIRRVIVGTRAGVMALGEGLTSCFLDFPLRGGLKLKDAKRSDLVDQIKIYEAQAKDSSHKAKWLNLVLQALPEGKAVGAVLHENRVKELFEESKNAD